MGVGNISRIADRRVLTFLLVCHCVATFEQIYRSMGKKRSFPTKLLFHIAAFISIGRAYHVVVTGFSGSGRGRARHG